MGHTCSKARVSSIVLGELALVLLGLFVWFIPFGLYVFTAILVVLVALGGLLILWGRVGATAYRMDDKIQEIILVGQQKLGRSLSDKERTFVASRGDLIALQRTLETVRSGTAHEVEQYLNSE
jgi:hypothetical protein